MLSHCVHARRVQREESGFCVKSAHFLRQISYSCMRVEVILSSKSCKNSFGKCTSMLWMYSAMKE